MKKRGKWVWEHKILAIVLLVVFAVAAPQPMKSQFLDPCCGILSLGLTTIGNTLNAVVGGGLKSIFSAEQDLQTFPKSVLSPPTFISPTHPSLLNAHAPSP